MVRIISNGQLAVAGLLALLMSGVIYPSAAPCQPRSIRVQTFSAPFTDPNEPLVYDLDGDGLDEVILGSQDGKLAVLSGPRFRVKWQARISERGLGSPAVAMLEGEPSLVVGSYDGTLHAVRPWDGTVRAKVGLGVAMTQVPSVAEMGVNNSVIVVPLDDGSIRALSFKNGEFAALWTAANDFGVQGRSGMQSMGRINQPVALGDLDGDGGLEAVAASSNGTVTVIPVAEPENRAVINLPQGVAAAGNIAMARFAGERREFVVSTAGGLGYWYRYEKSDGGSRLVENGSFNLNGAPLGRVHAVPYGDGRFSCLVVGTENQLGFFDGAVRFIRYGTPLASTSPPLSAPVLFFSGAKPIGFVSDARGDAFFHEPGAGPSDPLRGAQKLRGAPSIGRFSSRDSLQILFLDRAAALLHVADVDHPFDGDRMASSIPYGNFARTGDLGYESQAGLKRLSDAITGVAEASASRAAEVSGKDRGLALGLAKVAMSLRPANESVVRHAGPILRADENRRIVIWTIVAVAGLGPLAAFFLWRSARKSRRKRQLLEARQRLSKGAAGEALQVLGSAEPEVLQESSVFATYADIYSQLESPPVESLPVLLKAVERQPGHYPYRVALARAFLVAEPLAAEGFEAYAAVLDGKAGPVEASIALPAARAAISRNLPDDVVMGWLTVALSGPQPLEAADELAHFAARRAIYSDKYLPIIEASARRHPKDAVLWGAVVACNTALKRLDECAHKSAAHLLELDPGSIPARRLLGHCLFHEGEHGRAAEVVEAAGEALDREPELLVLLARIYGASRRRDGRALDVAAKALKVRPGDAALELIYVQSLLPLASPSELSAEDYVRLCRAVQNAPDDTELANALVQASSARSDHATTVQTLAVLRKSAKFGVEKFQAVAKAAMAGRIWNETTEKLLRDGLAVVPDDPVVLQALASCLCATERADPESISLLQRALTAGSASVEAAAYLAERLLQRGQFDAVADVIRQARAQFGDSATFGRIEAQAALLGHREEEGVQILEGLLARNPDDEAALLALADAYARTRANSDQARLVISRAIEVGFDRPTLRLALARCDAQAADFTHAIPNMKRAAADPGLADTVREEVAALVVAHPDQPQLRWFFTTLLIEQNRITEAVDQLSKVRDIDPSQHKLILSSLERILEQTPDHVGAVLLKAKLQSDAGNFDASLQTLSAIGRKAPGNTAVAEAHVEMLARALQKENRPEWHIAMGRAQMALERWSAAILSLQTAARDYKHEAAAGRLLGECYMRQGLLEYALAHLKAQPSTPELATMLLELAGLFESAGDVEGAKQALKHCLVVDGGNSAARKRLQYYQGITNDPVASAASLAKSGELQGAAAERYEIVEELGRGAMGIVYKARDRELDELVAIKILPENLNANDRALMRFKTEARSARRLAHPNIVRIHDMGESGGRKFISMEFIDGMDLKAYLRTLTKRLSLPEVYGIIYPVALALDYAHSNQIVHRDIKPANIMLTSKGIVKVSDFGIAKILESTSETMVGAVMGTPLYMSPEQIQGKAVDHRTDIYALGIMMYELISGRPPFIDGDLAYHHVHSAPEPIKGLPAEAWAIVRRALSKDMNDRFPTAGEMAAAMAQCPAFRT